MPGRVLHARRTAVLKFSNRRAAKWINEVAVNFIQRSTRNLDNTGMN
jgi:hypothetical protein